MSKVSSSREVGCSVTTQRKLVFGNHESLKHIADDRSALDGIYISVRGSYLQRPGRSNGRAQFNAARNSALRVQIANGAAEGSVAGLIKPDVSKLITF